MDLRGFASTGQSRPGIKASIPKVRVFYYPFNTRHRPLTQSIDSKDLAWMMGIQTTEGLVCPRHANQAMRRRSEGKGKGLTLVELTS
jgi:hypothetical protein